jgi:putative colanic acid biosynthesis glycosyltransferase
MKILQINTSVNTGSTGRMTEEIGQKIIDNGYESYIAGRKVGPDGSKSNLIEIGSDWDTIMHGLKTRVFDKHGFGSRRASEKLIQRIEEINPDAIGLHNLHGYYLNIEVLFNYLERVRKPVLWTLFDCWAFTGHCTYFDSIGCERWIDGCYSCPKKNKYPASYFLDRSKKNYLEKKEIFNKLDNLTFVTHSKWLSDLVKRSYLNQYSVKTMHSGVNLNVFKPGTEHLSTNLKNLDKSIVLGVASVWDERKGLKDFLKLNDLKNEEYQLVLVGLSDKQLQSIPDDIIGISRTENLEQLAALYSVADVFINPTWQDNFPTTNLEALACGTPVITYNTGGSPEALDEFTGFVVDKGDINAIHKSIQKIIEKGTAYYSTNCRQRAMNCFNKDEQFQKYVDLYKEMMV